MSIHIIDSSTNYGDLQKNTLYLDSTTDSNVITIKSGLEKTYINFEDQYSFGVSNQELVINNNNSTFMVFKDDHIDFNQDVTMYENINMKEKLFITEESITSFSNFNVSLFGSNEFKINDVVTVDINQIMVNSNMYIHDATLFVNNISPILENDILTIRGASFESGTIQNLTFEEGLLIDQTFVSEDITPISIKRSDSANTDIISIRNVQKPLYTINNKGYVGIGTTVPSSLLSLSTIDEKVIDFNGLNYGDSIVLTSNGNLGLGINTPDSRLHIKRTDDYTGTHVRNHPVLKMDMEYTVENNTSNYNTPETTQFGYDDTITASDPSFMLLHENTFINNKIQIDLENNVVQYNNILYNNNTNVDYVIPFTVGVTTKINLSIPLSNDYVFKTFTYRNNNENTFSALESGILTINYILCTKTYYFDKLKDKYGNEIIDSNIYDQDDVYYKEIHQNIILGDASLFEIKIFQKELIRDDNSSTFNANIRLYIQKQDPIADPDTGDYPVFTYNVYYDIVNSIIIPAPDFLEIYKNDDTFISSISANGTLSLGEKPAIDNGNFLLYNKGNAYIDTLFVNNLSSTDNTFLSFELKDVENIKNLSCQTLNVTGSLLSNTISSTMLNSSSISFETLNSDYLNFNENLLIFNASTKIITDSFQNIHDDNFFDRKEGILITDSTVDANPSIVVNGVNNSSIILKNDQSSYSFNTLNQNFELSKKPNADKYQTYIDKGYTPRIFKNFGNDQILSFGTQGNMNIRCSSLEDDRGGNDSIDTTRVSIGVPWGNSHYAVDNNSKQDSYSYFKNHVVPSAYTLNVFGNVMFSDNNGAPVMEIKNGKVRIYGDLIVNGTYTNNVGVTID